MVSLRSRYLAITAIFVKLTSFYVAGDVKIVKKPFKC